MFTVSLACGSSVRRGAKARLCLALAELEVVRVRKQSPAGVPDSLLLSRTRLSHINRVPGSPRGVPSDLCTRVQITRLVLLKEESYIHTYSELYRGVDHKGEVCHFHAPGITTKSFIIAFLHINKKMSFYHILLYRY